MMVETKRKVIMMLRHKKQAIHPTKDRSRKLELSVRMTILVRINFALVAARAIAGQELSSCRGW